MEATASFTAWEKFKAWIRLARPPFQTVGVLPFTLGSIIAWYNEGHFEWELWGLGSLAVVLVMLSTYWAGECFDHEEDTISVNLGRSRFAGGTGVVQTGAVTRRASFIGSIIALMLAACTGLIIWLGCGTGPFTIPLGIIGIVGGFLYSTPPVRWVSTGWGELWIGLCYGFLPVAVGYYLPTGRFDALPLIVAAPISATIFNVILGNEYPDWVSDRSTGKRNLLQRFGPEQGAKMYLTASIVGWAGVAFSVVAGVPPLVLAYYVPPLLASIYASHRFLRRKWKDRSELEVLCGLGIFANLGTTIAYILAFLWARG
jgi:1,4-dihydroxy-2-naphthoate polyprenyltransferase